MRIMGYSNLRISLNMRHVALLLKQQQLTYPFLQVTHLEILCDFQSFKDLELHTRDQALERLVLVSFTPYSASTPSLSTWWSSTTLK